MKRWRQIFWHNWRAKLASLAVATVVWLVVKHGIAYAPTLPAPPPLAPSGPILPG